MVKYFGAALIFVATASASFASTATPWLADGRLGVPEPSALAVLAIGLTTALRKRNR